MCIGIPLQVVKSLGPEALCADGDALRPIDMGLVGEQPAGTWVLVFRDAAREVLDAERAAQVRDALTALQHALDGETDFDRWFPDLVGREPELPDFLKPPAT